jgi:1A family penicillin-binding protein
MSRRNGISLYIKLLIYFLLFVGLAVLIFIFTLPRIPDTLYKETKPTTIYDETGKVVKVLANRERVRLDQVSFNFIDAIIALEDADFYSHHGLSKRSLLRALFYNLKSGKIRQGGSTITQQLAKNLFFEFDRTWYRKVKEFFIAIQLEQQFSKDEILEAYINQINFSSGVLGVEMASQVYFATHADELTLAEAVMLAGIPRWPEHYNPYKNFDIAKERQAFVLNRMIEENFIEPEEKKAALAEDVQLERLNALAGYADYFLDYIIRMASAELNKTAVYYGGLDIFSTLNAQYQYHASRAVQEGLKQIDDLFGLEPYNMATWSEKVNYPQAALVSLDVHTGEVRALVGGRDFQRTPFNRAISNNRHPGSAFKVFTYTSAVDKHIVNPATVVVDDTLVIRYDNQKWKPENFDLQYHGPMVVKYALMKSINVIAAKLIQRVGPKTVVDYARRMGIQSDIEANFSLALGATGIAPLELACAIMTLADYGVAKECFSINRITKFNGDELYENEIQSRRVLDAQTCYIMIDMMKGVMEEGTAQSSRRLGFLRPAAGKTGTSDKNRDSWFIGFTPNLITVVWVGFDDNRKMKTKYATEVTGASAALPIWTQYMKEALADEPFLEFPIPQGIEFKEVDPRTGSGPLPGGPSLRIAIRKK